MITKVLDRMPVTTQPSLRFSISPTGNIIFYLVCIKNGKAHGIHCETSQQELFMWSQDLTDILADKLVNSMREKLRGPTR